MKIKNPKTLRPGMDDAKIIKTYPLDDHPLEDISAAAQKAVVALIDRLNGKLEGQYFRNTEAMKQIIHDVARDMIAEEQRPTPMDRASFLTRRLQAPGTLAAFRNQPSEIENQKAQINLALTIFAEALGIAPQFFARSHSRFSGPTSHSR